MRQVVVASAVMLSLSGAAALTQQNVPLVKRIAHYDPAAVRKSPAVHEGAGVMNIGSMLENEHTDTNLWFLHRGTIPPKAGIGSHFHNNCEEMFIILDVKRSSPSMGTQRC